MKKKNNDDEILINDEMIQLKKWYCEHYKKDKSVQ